MSALNIIQPHSRESIFPICDLNVKQSESALNLIKQFKKPYTGLNCFLSWMEKICSPETAAYISAQRKILKLQSSVFDIPAWADTASKFSQDVSQISVSTTKDKKTQAIKKSLFTSLEFTNASIDVAQCFDGMNIIKLGPYSTVLSGVNCTARLILKVNEVQQNYAKLNIPAYTAPTATIMVEKQHAEKQWRLFELSRSVVGLYSILFSVLTLLSISCSSYWTLSASTLSALLSVIADLRRML